MDFDFSDEQAQLKDAVQRWVERGYTYERRRAVLAEGGFSRQAYTELAELGICGLYASPEFDGMGMGWIEGMVVMQELGRGLVLEPVTQALLCTAVLANYAPRELQTQWIPAIASGAALVVLAHQEQHSRYQLQNCQTTAEQTPEGFALRGEKFVVPCGDHAQALLVPAMLEDKLGLFLVECAAKGVALRGYATQDGSRAADVRLQYAPAQLVTLEGLDALQLGADIGMACACAQGVGLMEQALAITVEYLNTRKQFGVAIGSFQAPRHRASAMKEYLELARSMSYYASLHMDAPPAQRHAAVVRAKYQAGVAMRFIAHEAIQMHGGIGMTDEYIVSHFFRAMVQLEMAFGDTEHQLGEVSNTMQDLAGVYV